MRKIWFVLFVCILIAVTFDSCKQCNRTHDVVVVKNDTVGVPRLEEATAAIAKDSLNPALYYKRAQIYEASNDFKSAATDMYIALSLDSLRPEYYLYTAELFKKSYEPKRGLALMNVALATDSMNVNYYVKAAELAYIDTTVKSNYLLALKYLNAAILKDPQNANIYFYKGTIFKEVGDTAKALSSFQTATELNPKYYNAYVQMGLLLQRKKDKNAEKYLDNAIRVSEHPEDALYAKANLLKEQGMALFDAKQDDKATEKLNGAVDNFKRVIELNHRNIEAYMGAGKSYYQMDSVQEAYKYYEMAAKLDPTYAGAYFSQGLCAEELGRTPQAIQLYQTALNIDPNFTRANEHLKKLQKNP